VRSLLVGQPSADGAVEGVGVDAGQYAAHGCLRQAPVTVTAHLERGQDRLGRVSRPLADRDQGSGAGQRINSPPCFM
jgi:hypothetical protein